MLKFYSLLIGENPNYTAQFHPSGKRKVILQGNVIMLPVLMWFINGFLLVQDVLEGSLWAAMVTGFFLACLIFIIERSIILSNGSKMIMATRICLGFFIALLGSICLDEVVFKNDIDLKIAEYKDEHIQKALKEAEQSIGSAISDQEKVVNVSKNDWIAAEKEAGKEADGTGGSGIPKVGKIAIFKAGQAEKMEQYFQQEDKKLTSLRDQRNKDVLEAQEKAEANFNGKGLLIRVRALFDLAIHDWIMLTTYILFTLVIFLLEFMVVLIKMYSHDSIDEKLEKARDKELGAKMQRLMTRSSEYRNQYEILDKIQAVNQFLNQNPSNLLN